MVDEVLGSKQPKIELGSKQPKEKEKKTMCWDVFLLVVFSIYTLFIYFAVVFNACSH